MFFYDPVACYMDDFSSQNFHPLISCESVNEGDRELVSQPSMLFLQKVVSLQHFYENFQPLFDNHQLGFHENKRAVGGLIQNEINVHPYEDPFVASLELVSGPNFSYFVNIEFVFKFLDELPLSEVFFLSMNKDMQEVQPMKKMLAWLHWIFDFT
jgi:hypothetical protein